MADESRHARRRSVRSRRRLGIGLAFGLVLTVLAVGALVPAFADDSSSSSTQDATATTAAPDTTTATTAAAGTTSPPPTTKQDPPSTTQPSKSQAASTQQESTANVGTQSVDLVPCQNSGSNPNSFESDSRASPNGECFAGNFTSENCTTGSSFQSQDNPTGTDANSDISGTVTNSGTTLNITILNPNVVIGKIIVKGGNGYNVYTSPVSNMISPLNGGGNIPAISHWVVCYDVTTPQPGSLTVTKSVVGTPPGGASFTVAVDCNDGSGHDRTLTFDSTGALTGGGPLPITGIPAGTKCTVTETGTGSASSVTYTPGGANPPEVTVTANQQSSVTVTNTYNKPETGALQVQKTTEGDVPPGVSWKVSVTCTSPSFSTTLDFAPNDLGPKTVAGIPLSNGSNSCSVAETDHGTPPPTLVTVTPNSAQNITSGTTPLFTVLNSYPQGELFGSVSVTKAVTGDGKPDAGTQFTVHVSCTDGTEADLAFDTSGGTKQVTGIKIDEHNGTNCTVTEPETGHASHVAFSPDDNGKFTLTVNNNTHAITVTNRFDRVEVGAVTVLTGTGSVTGVAAGTLPFTGSPLAMLVKIAVWLLVIGGVALLIARKLRRRASPA